MIIDDVLLDLSVQDEFDIIAYRGWAQEACLSWKCVCDDFVIQSDLRKVVDLIKTTIGNDLADYERIISYLMKEFSNGYLVYNQTVSNVRKKLCNLSEIKNEQERCRVIEVASLIVACFICDCVVKKDWAPSNILEIEKIQSCSTNQYKLTNISGAKFYLKGFIYNGKGYYYNGYTEKTVIDQCDEVPGFIKIISQIKKPFSLLYRLDDTLLANCPEEILPEELAHGKQRGCQFIFSESQFRDPKSIIVHMDEQDTLNKLLMVVKTCFDENLGETFWHIELETLPYITGNKQKDVITTFMHGMYYPKRDVFTHIDFTKNQYSIGIYQKKYADSKNGAPIDQYTENSDLHYKIWCIEDGEFSKEEWYKLIKVSLDYEYQVLFDEMLRCSDISKDEHE